MEESSGSFIRWQTLTLEQLGYLIGLLMTFGAAALGFLLAIIMSREYAPNCLGRGMIDSALTSLSVSLAFGVCCAVNRLADFRETAAIARLREQRKQQSITEEYLTVFDEHPRREKAKELGRRTWALFRGQLICFGLGMLFLVVAIVDLYFSRLFG